MSNYYLTPAFSPNVTNYRNTVYEAPILFNAYPADAGATFTVSLNGTLRNKTSSGGWGFNFDIGENILVIKVTAQDTSVKRTYTVIVTRKADNGALENITLNTGSLSPRLIQR